MENRYNSLKEALEVAKERLEENQLLDDGATNWDIDNLKESIASNEDMEQKCDNNNYYCVGFDGRIGFTNDNGYNVQWLYTPV